jgi:hypothetical protein
MRAYIDSELNEEEVRKRDGTVKVANRQWRSVAEQEVSPSNECQLIS